MNSTTFPTGASNNIKGNNKVQLVRSFAKKLEFWRVNGVDYISDGLYLYKKSQVETVFAKYGLGRLPERVIKTTVEEVMHEKGVVEFEGVVIRSGFAVDKDNEKVFWMQDRNVYCFSRNERKMRLATNEERKNIRVFWHNNSSSRSNITVDPEGTPYHYLRYFQILFRNAKGYDYWALACLFLPVALDYAHAGFIFRGPAGTGKSTAYKWLGRLIMGDVGFTTFFSTKKSEILARSMYAKAFSYDDAHRYRNIIKYLLGSFIIDDEHEGRFSIFANTDGSLHIPQNLLDRVFVVDFDLLYEPQNEGKLQSELASLVAKARHGMLMLWALAEKEVEIEDARLKKIRFGKLIEMAYSVAKACEVEKEFTDAVIGQHLWALPSSC